MTASPSSCPMHRSEVIDRYFMEHRAKVIDIAAFLDRVDRARVDDRVGGGEDFRMSALREAIALLLDDAPDRARRVLDLLSDPTTEPIASAPMKGAIGAFDPPRAPGKRSGDPG